DRIDAAADLALNPPHRQALEVWVVLAVSADGVAFVVDAPDDGRIGTRHLADQEISGLHAHCDANVSRMMSVNGGSAPSSKVSTTSRSPSGSDVGRCGHVFGLLARCS